MTLNELDKDMAIAAVLAFKASSPDRRLAGAEWLQQLAGQLVEALKDEQFKPLAEAFDDAVRDDDEPEQPAEETPNPGEGWRLLQEGETIEKGDEFYSPSVCMWVESIDIKGTAYYFPYRRRIQPEPEKARYFYNGEPDYLRKIENGKLYAWPKYGGEEWFENMSVSIADVLECHSEITREEAIRIGGEP